MTINSQPSTYPFNNDNDDNLEIISLIWLDTNVHTEENQGIITKLRTIINHIKLFDDGEECKRYLKRRNKCDRIVLIANSQLARQIVAAIHELRQISRIYVRSTDKKSDEQWAHVFTKVRL